MKKARWSDGYVVNADPRREDPLYYYMQGDAWNSAIGFETEPLYHEHEGTDVTIGVFGDHRVRESALSPAAREEMYCRVLSVLLARFPKWLRVKVRSAYLPDLLGSPALGAVFEAEGFAPSGVGEGACEWRRA